MTMQQLLESINYLANQAKNRPLTEEEIALRQVLRQSYLALIRRAFQNQLEQVTVVDLLGNDITPQALRQQKDLKRAIDTLPDRMAQYLDSLPQYQDDQESF